MADLGGVTTCANSPYNIPNKKNLMGTVNANLAEKCELGRVNRHLLNFQPY